LTAVSEEFLPPSSEQDEKAPRSSEILLEFLSDCFTSQARRHNPEFMQDLRLEERCGKIFRYFGM
jgi:hypothetical protein